MANVITGRQWFLDTTGVVYETAVKIGTIIFTGLVAGDQCTLKDAAGRTVWTGVIGNELEPENSPKIGWVQGLTLTTLTNGNVIIYIE